MAKQKTNYTQRTLKELRRKGATAAVVEKWNPHARVTQDLFNFIDIIALRDFSIIGVQSTSGANHAARRKKIYEGEETSRWLECGGKIEIWSWTKNPVLKGSKRKVWFPRVEEITMESYYDYWKEKGEK